jgi:cytochrome c553
MRRLSLITIFSVAVMMMIIQSCNKNDTKISQANGRSHNAGRNCMGCHYSGGEGDGWFTAAGTAYSAADSSIFKNPVVQLYTGRHGTGTLVATIYGDGSGNFYTTSAIDYSAGLYASVVGATRTNYMVNPITMGACNSCHGVSQTKIIAN